MTDKSIPIESERIFASNPPGVTRELGKRSIFIAGAGGLGSNVAFMLTRAGIGQLTIADFDTVSQENLNRQQYFIKQIGEIKVIALKENLLNINPFVTVNTVDEKLTPNNFSNYISNKVDLIFECFDNPVCKAEIVRFCLEKRPEIPVVSVSGIAGNGPAEKIKVTRGPGKLYIIGDRSTEANKKNGTLSSRVTYAAALQTHYGISLILNQEPNVKSPKQSGK